MPKGVEHELDGGGQTVTVFQLIIPLMPKGVEHVDALQRLTKPLI